MPICKDQKSVEKAARHLLLKNGESIRRYVRRRPPAREIEAARRPTAARVWSRYATAVITAQTRMSDRFWEELRGDRRWHALVSVVPPTPPPQRLVASLLRDHGVRFPDQKATRIRKAASRDFRGISNQIGSLVVRPRTCVRRPHRQREVDVARFIQTELGGCGVAPKIARLMLSGANWSLHVVPIDSRWIRALRELGADVQPSELGREQSYIWIEEAICRASYGLGFLPVHSDGVAFGWISDEEHEP